MGDIFTATGAKFFVGRSVASTPANAAAYAALTGWTEVGLVESLGEYGDEATAVTFAALSDGRQRKGKGVRDAGQQALDSAEATNNNFAFKVVLPNRLTTGGTDEVQYFKGLVMSKRLNVGANGNVVKRTFNIGVNSPLTTTLPT